MTTSNDKSIADRIVELIGRVPELNERQVAQHLFGPRATQQRVNGDCRLLVARGVLKRLGSGGAADPFRYRLG